MEPAENWLRELARRNLSLAPAESSRRRELAWRSLLSELAGGSQCRERAKVHREPLQGTETFPREELAQRTSGGLAQGNPRRESLQRMCAEKSVHLGQSNLCRELAQRTCAEKLARRVTCTESLVQRHLRRDTPLAQRHLRRDTFAETCAQRCLHRGTCTETACAETLVRRHQDRDTRLAQGNVRRHTWQRHLTLAQLYLHRNTCREALGRRLEMLFPRLRRGVRDYFLAFVCLVFVSRQAARESNKSTLSAVGCCDLPEAYFSISALL